MVQVSLRVDLKSVSPCSDRRRTAGRSDAHPKGRNEVENLNGAKRREGCADGLACDDGSERE